MPEMVDPMESLISYQDALTSGLISPQRCVLDPQLCVFMDTPQGPSGPRRFSYTFSEGPTVTALALLVSGKPLKGLPCFDLGYAVAESHRNQGLAKQVVEAAIEEMQYGLARNKVLEFYVEAIVGKTNIASQRVAAKVIQQEPTEVTDEYSGEPSYRYVKLIIESDETA